MKDNRFIDLLNLYIDRQISAEETAELEAEIQRNPKRQAIYREYCKIHSATKVVYQSFRAGAGEPAAVPSTGRPATIELFESRRRRTNWAYYGGALAAAACLALVFVRQSPAGAVAQADSLAVSTARPAVVAPAVQASAAPLAPASLASDALARPVNLQTAVSNPDYSVMLAALREQDEERALANVARAQSLFNDNFFEVQRAAVSAQDVRSPRSTRPASSQQAEFTAFQFQR